MLVTPPPAPLVWNDETLSRFWGYHSQFPENYFSRQKGQEVVAHISKNLPDGGTVLDYGCGPGHLLPHLLDAGFVVQGADISLETMGSAVSLEGRDRFLGYATIDSLLNQTQTFDAVVLLEVVEHLDDHWLDITLKNARSLLKQGGVLVITTPNEERLEDSMVYCPASNVVFHRWQHMRSWSGSSLEQALRTHGFTNVKTETRTFTAPRSSNISPLRYWVSKIVTKFRKAQSLLAIARA